MFKRLTDWLAFTRTEQNVLLFLVGAFVLGTGIRLFRSDAGEGTLRHHASPDSLFAALSTPGGGSARGEPVNVNVATKAELIALPGIGDVTAERIITTREKRGPFRSAEDLLSVKGITRKKLEQLKPLITTH